MADKVLKNKLTLHAEANAILNASSSDLNSWSAYCTLAPCTHCSLLLIQKGINRVVHPKIGQYSCSWTENQQLATNLLREASIQVITYEVSEC